MRLLNVIRVRCLSIVVFCILAQYIPISGDILALKPSGAINDFANLLSPETKRNLEQLSINVWKKAEVALVMVTIPSLEGNSIDGITNRLYEKWGIGKKGKDEGVLVLLALKERKIRIETGYGIEGYITDLKANTIRITATERFLSKDNWNDGLSFIFGSFVKLIAKEKNIPIEDLLSVNQHYGNYRRDSRQRINPLQFLFFIVILLILLGTRTGRSMLPWILLGLLGSSRRTYSGGGGFGGGFGSSGGFGGFGGGMSGGGGSSGGF